MLPSDLSLDVLWGLVDYLILLPDVFHNCIKNLTCLFEFFFFE